MNVEMFLSSDAAVLAATGSPRLRTAFVTDQAKPHIYLACITQQMA